MKRLLVLSAPSGAGKTTIAHRLLERNPGWRFSISATTRPRRPAEGNGVDYFFIDPEEFRQRIAGGDLIEWEEIYGNYYGTLKSEIARALERDTDSLMVFDVDVKGAISIRHAFPDDAVLVFIAPPSFQELERRLRDRKTETDDVIRLRIERAKMEMQMKDEFDAVVVNDDIERATAEVEELMARYGAGKPTQ